MGKEADGTHFFRSSDVDQHIKSEPNFVFATWLVKMIGQGELRKGSGVIDVAGGNGLLSFELTCRYGVPSTVLDPRNMKFSAVLRRRMKKLTKNRLKDQNKSDKSKILGKRWINAVIEVNDDLCVLDCVNDAVSGMVDVPFQQYKVFYEGIHSPITSSRDCDKDLLSQASIFVGMHPDQATEAIVDSALALGKKFAVVPCCVFTKLFPDRKTSEGNPVRTYEEFIDYLQSKSSDIRRANLPYDCGRNVVLYNFTPLSTPAE